MAEFFIDPARKIAKGCLPVGRKVEAAAQHA
jgi:hypothetical protein